MALKSVTSCKISQSDHFGMRLVLRQIICECNKIIIDSQRDTGDTNRLDIILQDYKLTKAKIIDNDLEGR